MNKHSFFDQRGYVMLVALLVMGMIGIIGATTLSVAGIDQRIAHHNQKYMMLINTSRAGTDHGRMQLADDEHEPEGENWDTMDTGNFVVLEDADELFDGLGFDQNLGVYWVDAVFEKCGNPPPGYSTEAGNAGFRSDYWELWSSAQQMEDDGTWSNNKNETITTSVATERKIMSGECKFR